MLKTHTGHFFEDFKLHQIFHHATPRTVHHGDVALYQALFGSRFAVQSADPFAQSLGYPASPLDDFLVFHLIFGKTVPDISFHAVANLGYAACHFLAPVYPGDSLQAKSQVIGLRENANKESGIVYVHSSGTNQRGEKVLDFVRWVMVRKKDPSAACPVSLVPSLSPFVKIEDLGQACPLFTKGSYPYALSGSSFTWEDYERGERMDHKEGVTIEEAEHQLATRLYQNNAQVHFNHFSEKKSRFGRRLVYGGHVISLARALSFNGLANGFHVSALNGGRHLAPVFGGDTLFAWSEILDKQELPLRKDIGALRVRTISTKDRPCTDFPLPQEGHKDPSLVLDLDYWLMIPRR